MGTTCFIYSKAGLVVRAVNRTSVVAGKPIPSDERVQWTLDYVSDNIVLLESVADKGHFLSTNGAPNSKLALVPPRGDKHEPYQLWNVISVREFPPGYDWGQYSPVIAEVMAFTGPRPFTIPTGWLAIRPSYDTDRNLNILGNGPYAPGDPIEAWHGWSAGAPNELWTFMMLD